MNKLMYWLTNSFAPKMNKFASNPWVSSIQQSIYSIMPVILFGSIISMIGALRVIIPVIPDISLLSSFSFGLLGLFVAFLFPYNLMEKKGQADSQIMAAVTSLGLFLMLIYPSFDEEANIIIEFARFGSGGMLCAFLSGIFTSLIWLACRKVIKIKASPAMPSFVVEWVNALTPVSIIIIIGYLCTFVFEIKVYAILLIIFQPVFGILQTLPGYMIISFIQSFCYSMGISTHVFNPFLFPLYINGVEQNIANAAIGANPSNFVTFESVIAFNDIGGTGNHLALCLMMILLCKSKRLKAIGKATLPPVCFNINEPVLFGAPIVFNPLLMIPMWIQGLLFPALMYFAMHSGLVPFSTQLNTMYQIPPFLVAFIVFGIRGLIFAIFLFILSGLIYFPFLKAYDRQILSEENA
jgi:Phosphotransferase system cellobiose-specific component IIC